MSLLDRLFGSKRSEKLRSATSSHDAPPNDDAVVAASAQGVGAQVAAGSLGHRWADDKRSQNAGPEYIPAAVPPTEEDWAHEAELYRRKGEDRADPPAGGE